MSTREDRADNLAMDFHTLNGRLTLAMANLCNTGADVRATEDLRLFILQRPSPWGQRVLAALDGVPPHSPWQDVWEALYGVRRAMSDERSGYMPS